MDLLKGLVKLLLWIAALLLIATGILRAFFVDQALIGHNAMAPTIVSGEEVLLWTKADVELGDIVVCENPGPGAPYLVGRVIATEGMEVGTDDYGRLVIDERVAEVQGAPTIRFHDRDSNVTMTMHTGIEKRGNSEHAFFHEEGAPFVIRSRKVGPNRVYLLGDNRSFVGMDSRYVGDIEADGCIGQVFMRLRAVGSDEGETDLGHGDLDIVQ